ncbi:hypothetical protein A2U01_0000161, partial [Trifolium medium]|nr:hypothetical protein [Trifolium medium]
MTAANQADNSSTAADQNDTIPGPWTRSRTRSMANREEDNAQHNEYAICKLYFLAV